jgi:F0F1-type ATP synthase assembly protein I
MEKTREELEKRIEELEAELKKRRIEASWQKEIDIENRRREERERGIWGIYG